jgi:hypothetical protein
MHNFLGGLSKFNYKLIIIMYILYLIINLILYLTITRKGELNLIWLY